MTSITYLDYQEEKKANRALKAQLARLTADRDAWKQACHNKDKLLGIISHDLKGQLGGINGLINILELENQQIGSNDSQKYFELLKQSSSTLFQLLDNLLHWARHQTWSIEPKKTKGNLLVALKDIYELNNSAAQAKGINYSLECPPDFYVETDFNLMSLIVRNLITNAIKYTPTGGKILIHASKEGEQNILIKVSDSGIGIPPKVQARLFDRQAMISTIGTANEVGTGLGLILCLEFAQMLGSPLHIHSLPQAGTSCSFFIKAIPAFKG